MLRLSVSWFWEFDGPCCYCYCKPVVGMQHDWHKYFICGKFIPPYVPHFWPWYLVWFPWIHRWNCLVKFLSTSMRCSARLFQDMFISWPVRLYRDLCVYIVTCASVWHITPSVEHFFFSVDLHANQILFLNKLNVGYSKTINDVFCSKCTDWPFEFFIHVSRWLLDL